MKTNRQHHDKQKDQQPRVTFLKLITKDSATQPQQKPGLITGALEG